MTVLEGLEDVRPESDDLGGSDAFMHDSDFDDDVSVPLRRL
jgi:hypothetical protein